MTTQLDIKGVFDTTTGALTGFAVSGGAEIPLTSLGVGGDSDVIVNSRNGQGQVTSYTQSSVTYTVTYGPYGPATVSGAGKITTYNYTNGLLTSTTTV